MSKWLSRKLAVVGGGCSLATAVPLLFKQFGVSENVTLAALALVASLTTYYLKANKDSKGLESGSTNGPA